MRMPPILGAAALVGLTLFGASACKFNSDSVSEEQRDRVTGYWLYDYTIEDTIGEQAGDDAESRALLDTMLLALHDDGTVRRTMLHPSEGILRCDGMWETPLRDGDKLLFSSVCANADGAMTMSERLQAVDDDKLMLINRTTSTSRTLVRYEPATEAMASLVGSWTYDAEFFETNNEAGEDEVDVNVSNLLALARLGLPIKLTFEAPDRFSIQVATSVDNGIWTAQAGNDSSFELISVFSDEEDTVLLREQAVFVGPDSFEIRDGAGFQHRFARED